MQECVIGSRFQSVVVVWFAVLFCLLSIKERRTRNTSTYVSYVGVYTFTYVPTMLLEHLTYRSIYQ